MMDLVALDAEAHARYGDLRPLAAWIEAGHALTPTMRAIVAAQLRGEVSRQPGNKRTWAQQLQELHVLATVRAFENFEHLMADADHVTKGIKTRALEAAAEHHNISVDTVKKYKRNRVRKPR